MIGNNSSSVAVLRNHVEVVLFGHDFGVDPCACLDVSTALVEESFRGFGVDHDDLKRRGLFLVHNTDLFQKHLDEVLP